MARSNIFNELQRLLDVSTPEGSGAVAERYLSTVSNTVKAPLETSPTAAVSGILTPGVADDGEARALARQLAELTGVARDQTKSTEANTQAVVENSLAQAAEGKTSKLETVGKSILSFLGSGFGIAQVLGKLLDRGGSSVTTPTSAYSVPSPVNIEAGILGGLPGLSPIRYGQAGLPQAAAGGPPVSPTPVTIQVQALDSRSIVDHSSEIAMAVKEALLNSHSLNDVVTEI